MSGGVFADRYRLEERLGSGGMSEVWAAEDTELARPVALKLIAPQADRERFRREARAVAALSHPNITRLFDYGEAEGRPYMVLERLSGGSLAERLQGGPLPDIDTERIAREIAAGLAAAHAHGLVHRDLKPANILFDDEGRAKIADFGIARIDDAGTLTEAGTVIGTATTISPEQAAGEPATPASDIYSFGALLAWMLTGRPPFDSDRPLELLQLHRNAPPPAIRELRPDAPPGLAALSVAALAKDPSARPPNGAALLEALDSDDVEATLPLAGPPPPSRPAPGRRRPPRAALVALAVAALAAAGAAAALFLVRGDDARPAPAATTTPSLTLPSVTTAEPATATAPPTTAGTEPSTASTTEPTTTEASTTEASTTRETSTAAATTVLPSLPTTTIVGTTTFESTSTDLGTTTTDTTIDTTTTVPATTVGSVP